MTPSEEREGGPPLQTSHVTVKVVLVSGSGTRIGVLPESVVFPSSRQSANAARIASDPQWAGRTESGAVTGASLPPISGGVDDRVAANAGVVGVGKIADPANHRSRAQAIASGAIRVICPINDDVQLMNRGRKNILSVHSRSRAPGRVTPSPLQPPPLEAK